MRWQRLKQSVELFDKRGLSADTIQTLRLLVLAVIGGMIFTNITGGIGMTGYMKALGASDFLYGVVLALTPLANAFQFAASYWLERTLKRKTLFLVSGFIQRAIWIPFALVPFVIPMQYAQLRLWSAVVCVLVSAGMAPFMNVSFYSICSDVVPLRIRGRYFATRSRVSTAAGLLVGLLVGALLDALPGFPGYCCVFLIAGAAGILDICCFLFMKLPPMKPTPDRGNLGKMIRSVLGDKPYMRTILCLTAWFFSVQLCAPYFNVYMRDVMRMSNFNITLYNQIVNNVFLILCVSRWGRAIDQYGNKPVLRLAAFCCCFTPLLFVFTGEGMLYMVVFAFAISGAAYCAVDLGAQNLFMGQAPEANRSMYFAVYFIFTQLFGIALGSAAGGWLLDNVLYRAEAWGLYLGRTPLTRYNWLFLIAGALRLLAVLFLLPMASEPGAQPVSAVLADIGLAWRKCRAAIAHGYLRRQYHRNKSREDE